MIGDPMSFKLESQIVQRWNHVRNPYCIIKNKENIGYNLIGVKRITYYVQSYYCGNSTEIYLLIFLWVPYSIFIDK